MNEEIDDDTLRRFAQSGEMDRQTAAQETVVAHNVPAIMMPGSDRMYGAQPVAVRRDNTRIRANLVGLASMAGTDWFYRWPVKEKQADGSYKTKHIEGPSIKLANDVARIYGNCDVDVRVFDMGDRWLFYARFLDIETGYSLTRPFLQRKGQASIRTNDPDRGQDIAFQIGASKAIRNVVCNALQTYSDFAFEQARSDIVERIGKDLAKYTAKVLARLTDMNIPLERVERSVGRTSDTWLATDVARIVADLQAIQDGMALPDETFPKDAPPPDQAAAAPADPAPAPAADQAAKAPAPKPATAKKAATPKAAPAPKPESAPPTAEDKSGADTPAPQAAPAQPSPSPATAAKTPAQTSGPVPSALKLRNAFNWASKRDQVTKAWETDVLPWRQHFDDADWAKIEKARDDRLALLPEPEDENQ